LRPSNVAALVGAAGLAALATFSFSGEGERPSHPDPDSELASAGRREVVLSDQDLKGLPINSSQSREAVELPASSSAVIENIIESSREDRLHTVLTSIRGSFLTTNPNLRELQALVTELVDKASVDKDSVDRRPNGDIEGKLVIADSNLTASYIIDTDGDYQVVFSEGLQPEESPFDYFRLTLGFHVDPDVNQADGFRLSAPHYRVQYTGLPANIRHADGDIIYGDRTLQGWHFMIQPDGSTKATPLVHSMPGDDTSFSDSRDYPQPFESWAADSDPHHSLFTKLHASAN